VLFFRCKIKNEGTRVFLFGLKSYFSTVEVRLKRFFVFFGSCW